MKKILYTGLFFTAFLWQSCGDSPEKKQPKQSVEVTTAVVEDMASSNFLTVSGKVEAEQSATLSTRTMGYVQRVLVDIGQQVHQGQLLLSINNADLQAQKQQAEAGITQAQAAFNIAEKDYNRFKNLFESKSASQKEFDDITANYNMAKARLDAAQQMKNGVSAQMQYTEIRAPFSGVITQKMINEGDLANPGVPLLAIENAKNMEIFATVPETQIIQIKKGESAKIFVSSIDEEFSGKVTHVSTSAANTAGQYMVKLRLEKPSEKLKSGMYANVQFNVKNTKQQSSKVMIPKAVLVKRGELIGIYTVGAEGTAILRWLRLGETFGDSVEVLSGLAPGETYIVTANGKLYNGVSVKN